MKKVSWEALPRIIGGKTSAIVKEQTIHLKNDLVAAWPVKSGRSRAGWKVRTYKTGHYAVVNFVKSPKGYNYVADLWEGTPRGSEQLPNGGDPILYRNALELRKRLDRMKL